jgi:general secretion pathway protein M
VNKIWQNLNERERWMAIAAALALSLYLFYAVLYSPISENLTINSEQLLEKVTTLQWMKTVKPNLAGKSKKTITNSQLLTLLAMELKTTNTLKYPYQLQQTGSGEIQLSFEQVPFQNVIIWLAKLKEDYAITIKQFNAERTPTSGLTKLLVVISAGS